MSFVEAATWVVGVGSAMGLLSVVINPDRPSHGIRFGTMSTNRERLAFSLRFSGVIFAALGGVGVMIEKFPEWWFALVVVALAMVAVWLTIAWKLHQYWQQISKEKARNVQAEIPPDTSPGAVRTMQHLADVSRHCATWRYCLRHPLNTGSEMWPERYRLSSTD